MNNFAEAALESIFKSEMFWFLQSMITPGGYI